MLFGSFLAFFSGGGITSTLSAGLLDTTEQVSPRLEAFSPDTDELLLVVHVEASSTAVLDWELLLLSSRSSDSVVTSSHGILASPSAATCGLSSVVSFSQVAELGSPSAVTEH
ncbi:hypothetical protein DPMN_079414 [Dreissena polymorpha]|uniref:Secreted protein n=1 Tax=Dreissena polymorpha TaxID=45954 RepID=A0A9D4BR09_DREPO|nr:hypothetical protein DPMN_079414 [Dreissena polymorpha]